MAEPFESIVTAGISSKAPRTPVKTHEDQEKNKYNLASIRTYQSFEESFYQLI